ncbi:hypothetical protein N0V90_011671 [Kalmusia sp. IMI 367209]|nr:hypothetical protein N0V90_011671 [Kalmusia sp. IMI 367209]
MGDRDPISPSNGNSTRQFDPTASNFHSANGSDNMNQVSPSSYHDLQFMAEDLEREQGCLRSEVSDLWDLCKTLRTEIDTLKKGSWTVTVGPFQGQTTSRLDKELGALKGKPSGDCDDANDDEKKSNVSIPPHLRAKMRAGNNPLPPQVREGPANGSVYFRPVVWPGTDDSSTSGKSVQSGDKIDANNPLITDGCVDNLDSEPYRSKKSLAEPTPPTSPLTKREMSLPQVEHLSLAPYKHWKPAYIASLPALPHEKLEQIPALAEMTSFSADFLINEFGGITWGPGIRFVPPPAITALPSRVYYTVDLKYDPHLPRAPGEHGAKMVPFFNINPEDCLDFNLPDDFNSSENVPLFVLQDVPDGGSSSGATRKRYVYYGHYSQTRWSDKLDYDRMAQCVPAHVREYWAEELSATGRPEWITQALEQHFFPVPEYHGRFPGILVDEGGSVAEQDLEAREKMAVKDVHKYVERLRGWKKDANMRASMIKKDFILQAFDQADADEPKALRLWWEYLECVDWRPDFYNTLVTLQSRNATYT